jgi:hypothetical protein
MAFIPIDARADIEGSKKGKLTPAQHAQLNAWCLASKTGILDFPQDHNKMGRCEAKNLDVTPINNQATIEFNRGYIVICGRLVECEEGSTVSVNTPIGSGTIKGKIIARFSLSNTKESEFVVTTTSGSLRQDDLNEQNIDGVYELELYDYTATSLSVSLTRTQPYIPDLGGKLAQFEDSLMSSGKPLNGYDVSKGTIEERLTTLGFREATIEYPSEENEVDTIVEKITAFSQGTVVAVDVKLTGKAHVMDVDWDEIIDSHLLFLKNIDLSMLPSDGIVLAYTKSYGSSYHISNAIVLLNNGEMILRHQRASVSDTKTKLQGGFYHCTNGNKVFHIEY